MAKPIEENIIQEATKSIEKTREGFEMSPEQAGQITAELKNTKVLWIQDENYDKDYNWEDGANKIKQAIDKPIDFIFSSEESYTEIFSKLYPEAKHILIDPERKGYKIIMG